ncbi:MAG TPA: Maf family nucleotide pyrophosphatase [Candidatus Limnocylindria bacterium]|nr:Maf family nucleotide pyrophosphatase [Candidatus Limnocylindria bacterium]
MTLVVASASPRRHELLAALGLRFEVAPADIDEEAAAGTLAPADAALAVATAKAAAVPRPDALVLAADTLVVLDGELLGKPASPAEARRMLARLRARTHRVFTAVCLAAPDGTRTAVVESEVRMRAYRDEEIEAYVAAGGGLDKAGAYGIQDEPLRPVEAIGGCWCNVMGLPLWTTWSMLRSAGLLPPRAPDEAFARCAACPLRERAA